MNVVEFGKSVGLTKAEVTVVLRLRKAGWGIKRIAKMIHRRDRKVSRLCKFAFNAGQRREDGRLDPLFWRIVRAIVRWLA